MEAFLHCINLSDKLKCLNLCSTGTLSSLLTTQLFVGDERPNPMSLDIEKLKNCREEEINGMSSPRMIFVFKRAILNSYSRELTEEERKVVEKGDLEIELERTRRIYNPGAPSRLSCLYLVEDSEEGRDTLGNMFRGVFKSPMILSVGIKNRLEMMQFDFKWVEQYCIQPQEKFLEGYWSGIKFNERPSWEYLLEGTIKMTDANQIAKIEDHVANSFPTDYQSIVRYREELAKGLAND